MILAISITDLANIATIAGLPLTILTWLFTRERFTKFWKKWFKWILLPLVIIAIVGLWRIGCLDWLRYKITCPFWLFILLPFSGLAIALCIVALYCFLDRTPGHFSYVSDNILGVQWQWRWQAGTIDDLVPICPKPACSCRLDHERSSHLAIDGVSLVCDHCGFTKDYDCNWDDLRWRVLKEIDRRIRTGEFKERLQKDRRIQST